MLVCEWSAGEQADGSHRFEALKLFPSTSSSPPAERARGSSSAIPREYTS